MQNGMSMLLPFMLRHADRMCADQCMCPGAIGRRHVEWHVEKLLKLDKKWKCVVMELHMSQDSEWSSSSKLTLKVASTRRQKGSVHDQDVHSQCDVSWI